MLLRNVEALRLYREILRTTRLFHFPNESGEMWSTALRAEARKEFEQARYEKDPETIARLMFVGWDCITQTKEKYAAKSKVIDDDIRNPSPQSPP